MEFSKICTPYTPLDRRTRDIRLITLLPTVSDHETLRCAMMTYSLDAVPPYTALSYEWGSKEDECIIQVNDSPMYIRKNLWAFLNMAMMQSELSNRFFWIDALCINQADLAERSHQVGLMAEIYQGTELVVSWLGAASDESNLALQYLASFAVSLNPSGKSREQGADAILRLCRQSYWSRLWVLQELVLASECIVYAGERSASIFTLEAYLGHAAFTLSAAQEEECDPGVVAMSRILLNSPASLMLKERRRGPFNTPIFDRVLVCGRLKCQDQKDKVYAVLGISQPSKLFPDYTISTCKVLNELLENCGAFDKCKSLEEARVVCDMLAEAVGVDAKLDILSTNDCPSPGDVIAALAEKYHINHATSGISLWWTRVHGHAHLQRIWWRERYLDARRLLNGLSYEGDELSVQMLLNAGFDVNADVAQRLIFGALYAASSAGHEKVLQLLLDTGVDINPETDAMKGSFELQQESYEGRMTHPLEAASYNGHVHIVRILIRAGAYVNARGAGEHDNALQAASLQGHEEVVQQLLLAGAEVNYNGHARWGPALQAASVSNNYEIVRMLLQAGAAVNARGGIYGSALHAASRFGDTDLVQILIQAGADVNLEEQMDGSALQVAACYNCCKAVVQILKAGADVNGVGGRRGSALRLAASKGNKEMVQLLIDAGADVNAEGGEYDSALNAATDRGHREVVEILKLAEARSIDVRFRKRRRIHA